MEERNQSKLKSPDDSVVGTQSKGLCPEKNLLRSMEIDSFKKFSFQMERAINPLKDIRVQMAEMKRLNDSLRVPVRLADPLKDIRIQMAEMKRLNDSLKCLFDWQILSKISVFKWWK